MVWCEVRAQRRLPSMTKAMWRGMGPSERIRRRSCCGVGMDRREKSERGDSAACLRIWVLVGPVELGAGSVPLSMASLE